MQNTQQVEIGSVYTLKSTSGRKTWLLVLAINLEADSADVIDVFGRAFRFMPVI